MRSTKTSAESCAYLGVDITDRHSDTPRAMDVCGLEISDILNGVYDVVVRAFDHNGLETFEGGFTIEVAGGVTNDAGLVTLDPLGHGRSDRRSDSDLRGAGSQGGLRLKRETKGKEKNEVCNPHGDEFDRINIQSTGSLRAGNLGSIHL